MKFIPDSVSSKVAVTALKASKHSPNLLFAGGVVGVVGTVVLASRATLKLEGVLEEAKETLHTIDTVDHPEYTPEDKVKDKALLRVKTALKVGKLYAPSIALGAVSIGMLAGSHNMLTKRNAALTAAYATLEKGFKQYRDRVIEDLGEDKDRQYRYGAETVKVTETDETGKKVQVEKKVATGGTPYGVFFREGNPNWNNEPSYNLLFLRGIQNHLNDKLQAYGYLFLSDVYKDLGVLDSISDAQLKAGRVVGWRLGNGDDYVDFGLFDDKDQLRIHDYVTGREGELYLDFNVDGNIFDTF